MEIAIDHIKLARARQAKGLAHQMIYDILPVAEHAYVNKEKCIELISDLIFNYESMKIPSHPNASVITTPNGTMNLELEGLTRNTRYRVYAIPVEDK